MVQGEERKRKGVLGLRLSHLSRHQTVREHIRQRMADGEDLLVIVRSIAVDGRVIDVVGDDKDPFADHLEALENGAGDAYLSEVGQKDKPNQREHDWNWWVDRFQEKPELRGELDSATNTVLGYEANVDVYGLFERPTSVQSKDTGNPQLVFQVEDQLVAQKFIAEEPDS